jgi:hypothetical protein
MFEKAIRIATVELKEELLWENKINFLENLWFEIRNELGEVQWTFDQFIERVNQEVESRKIDLRKFRNEKNEPVTNMFKKIIREIAKDSNVQLSNDSLSRLLNYIRNQYSSKGILTGVLYPVEAFFERSKYGIPDYYETGDDNSCFRAGWCNYGSSLWLKIEDEKYDRAKFVVFHYKSGDKEGWGRCWVYKVSDWAIFATNFYSYGFEIKSDWLKFPVVRVLRKLAGLTENVRFAYKKNIDLPTYLNGDGVIIYEKEKYSCSDDVIEVSREIVSECMSCGDEVPLRGLDRFEGIAPYYREREKVSGLIVCKWCMDELENSEFCAGCGEMYHRDDMYNHGGVYWCEGCFYERFGSCEYCGEFFCLEHIIVDRYGNLLCQDCAMELRRQCVVCGEYDYPEEVQIYKVLTDLCVEKAYICSECQKDFIKMKCEKCGYEYFYSEKDYRADEKIREIVRAGLCNICYEEKLRELKMEIFDNEKQPSLP